MARKKLRPDYLYKAVELYAAFLRRRKGLQGAIFYGSVVKGVKVSLLKKELKLNYIAWFVAGVILWFFGYAYLCSF